MTDLDELSAKQVAIDGHHMKLKGADRLLAIKLMADRGVIPKEMALRLRITVDYLQRLAKEATITLPREVKPVHWTYDYVFVRDKESKKLNDAARERERTRIRRARKRG